MKQDDVGVLKLLNWNNPFGICLAEPLEIARLTDQDESKVLLLASNQGIGKSNKLELQLLLQGKH